MDIIASTLDFFKVQLFYSSILFALLLPVIVLAQKRLPLLSIGLCWIFIIRLVLPPSTSTNFSIRTLLSPSNSAPTNGATNTHEILSEPFYLAVENLSSNEPSIFLFTLFALWTSGALIHFIKFQLNRHHFKKMIKRATHIRNPNLIRVCAVWRAKFSIKRPVSMVSSDQFSMPFTIGTLRPVIHIPRKLLTHDNEKNLIAIISHEMAHIKRYDDLKIIIQNYILSIYFFNPLLWYCIKKINYLREPLCDQLVINAKLISVNHYGTSLLNTLNEISNKDAHNTCHVTLGSNDQAQLKNRFYYIKRIETMKYSYKWLTCLSLLLLGLFSLPMAAVQSKQAAELAKHKYPAPVKSGWVSSKYGQRPKPAGNDKGKIKFHSGIDIANKEGTPVYPISAGVVREAGFKRGLGNRIVIEHISGMRTVYAQLKDLKVTENETVTTDDVIGVMAGIAPNTTGPHLHFEVYINRQHADPSDIIDTSHLTKQ